ncbi:hypothetical protein F0562_018074 [Nyssa sinensis]|uniref:Uncharacterized protein n=1 Tax=Nyssa sinensis TaxID=561372 RepID=A0A5J4Z8K4_9ASTE|nr:hypothetical protein F0562_018074 [Nyssa sinensis]
MAVDVTNDVVDVWVLVDVVDVWVPAGVVDTWMRAWAFVSIQAFNSYIISGFAFIYMDSKRDAKGAIRADDLL